jgi:hypothetical protein
MDRDAHRQAVLKWIGGEPPACRVGEPLDGRAQWADLTRALYAVSELGLWPDSVDSLSVDQAVMCWRIVERLRATGEFPRELAM